MDFKVFNELMWYLIVEEPRRRLVDEDPDIQEDDNEIDSNALWREVCGTAMELLVHIGLINAIIGQYPPHVKEGLIERMQMLKENLEKEIEITTGFGEAFDESGDDD